MNDWREAFLAMSVLFNEPVDAFLKDLDLPLARDLEDQEKSRRALSLSRALGAVALAAESLQLDLPS